MYNKYPEQYITQGVPIHKTQGVSIHINQGVTNTPFWAETNSAIEPKSATQYREVNALKRRNSSVWALELRICLLIERKKCDWVQFGNVIHRSDWNKMVLKISFCDKKTITGTSFLHKGNFLTIQTPSSRGKITLHNVYKVLKSRYTKLCNRI